MVAPHTRCVDWNLKSLAWEQMQASRTSHEVRGLKYCSGSRGGNPCKSHLTRGAWIEIKLQKQRNAHWCSRTSHEVRGLKWSNIEIVDDNLMSHLTRGAWIEIGLLMCNCLCLSVAPHTRCVDWNWTSPCNLQCDPSVAPHTRCVDWNISTAAAMYGARRRTSHEVRGLKCNWRVDWRYRRWSHLTRGAWIEI